MAKFRFSSIVAVLALSCAVGALPSRAAEPEGEEPAGESGEASEEVEENVATDLESLVRVVQQRPVLKAMRFELNGTAGVSTADVMHDQYSVTATGRFHISEWLSIGATYGKYFTSQSQTFRDVTGDLEVYPEISRLEWYAGADVSLVMFDGKFKLFDDAIGYWDLHALIGGGVTKTSRGDAPLPTGMLGLGMRIFVTPWLTLNLEVRDHIYVESFSAGSRLVNSIVGQAGLSIFIPFGFDYSYPK